MILRCRQKIGQLNSEDTQKTNIKTEEPKGLSVAYTMSTRNIYPTLHDDNVYIFPTKDSQRNVMQSYNPFSLWMINNSNVFAVKK